MKRIVDVSQMIAVEVPDTLLTEEFMAEFREQFYDFTTPEEHLCHLAQMFVRGIIHEHSFIEGYGSAEKLGIHFTFIGQQQDIVGSE